MKKLIYLILLFSFAIYSESKRDGAWVKVEVLSKSVVIGEPVYIRLQKYGTPYVGDIYLDGKICDDPYYKSLVEYSVPPTGETFKRDKNLKEKVKDVSFNILNNCNLKMKEMEVREYEVCYKDKILKACDRFSFKYPEGEDLKVYEKMDKGARDFTFPDSGITREELLENYPTSTYAGWVLFNYHFKYNPFNQFEDKRAREERIKYKDKILEFLKYNENSHLSGYLSSVAAYICSQIEDYNCACEYYGKSLNLKWDVPFVNEGEKEKKIKELRKILERLKKEGKCK